MKPTIYPVGERASLYAIRTDRFKSEMLSVQLAIPTREQTAQSCALLLELLRRGTQHYPTKALFCRRLDDLYASSITPFNRRAGDMQLLGLAADFLGERFVGGNGGLLPHIIELMAELLYRPYLQHGQFHEPYVQSERRHLLEAIRARINDPRAYTRAKCRALLCRGEPYALSLIGEEDTVDAITALSLVDTWHTLLSCVTPTFFYVGNSDPARVAELLTVQFDTARGEHPVFQTEIRAHTGEPHHCTEQMPLYQAKLSIGYRTDVTLGHPLSAATAVLNEVFGGSAASKLFLGVREQRSLCYHCSSSLDLFKGTMLASAGMKVDNARVTGEAMRAEFDAIVRGEITKEELDAAKHSLGNAYRQMYDNPGALFGFYTGRALMGVEETVESRRDAMLRVTKEDVVRAAAHVREGASFFLEGTLAGEEEA